MLERLWPLLRDLDGAARCGICKEVLQGAVSAPCGHSFCALCLRTALAAQAAAKPPQRPHCPACRAGSDTPGSDYLQVRPALQVQALAAAFQAVRGPLLELVGGLGREGGREGLQTLPAAVPAPAPAPAPAPISGVTSAAAATPSPGPAGGAALSRLPGGTPPRRQASGAVPKDACECPVCGRFYSAELIARHVDLCLARQEHEDVHAKAKRERERARQQHLKQQQHRAQPQCSPHARSRSAAEAGPVRPAKLAMLCYQRGVLSDRELKRHLANLGLPTSGSREALVTRHKDFSNRFNAAIESGAPKTVEAVAAEVQQEERALNQAAGGGAGRRKLGVRSRQSAGAEVALFRRPADPWPCNPTTPAGGKVESPSVTDARAADAPRTEIKERAAKQESLGGGEAQCPAPLPRVPRGGPPCGLCGAPAGSCGCPEAGAFPETLLVLDSEDEEFEVPAKKARRQSSRLQAR